MAQWDLTVDGHRFLVRDRTAEPGVYDVDWLTGPPGYGFSSASSDGSAMTAAAMDAAVRRFLAQVDPQTGHIE